MQVAVCNALVFTPAQRTLLPSGGKGFDGRPTKTLWVEFCTKDPDVLLNSRCAAIVLAMAT